MLASIHANGHTFQGCRDAMKKSAYIGLCRNTQTLKRCVGADRYCVCADIGLDDGFKEFYDWVKANDLPFVIISRHA